ncbi:hypothetical protein AERO9A_250200 [Aeromonas salmonicida]|nr:hypothetical protein AERO9A_250200 [Aeromonas salmonicida]
MICVADGVNNPVTLGKLGKADYKDSFVFRDLNH